MSANQAKILGAAGDSFPLNFVDIANAPAEDFTPALDPDGENWTNPFEK